MSVDLLIERDESVPILEHNHGKKSDEEEGKEEEEEEEAAAAAARLSCRCFYGKVGLVGSVRMGFKHASTALLGPRVKGIFTRLLLCSRNKGGKTKRNTGFAYDPRSYALNFDHGCNEESD